MGLFLTKETPDARLGIWEITEPEEELYRKVRLSASEKTYFTSLKSPLRKKHWLSYRLILPHLLSKHLVSSMHYDAFGKPHLDNGAGYISVAHSGKFAVLIFSPEKEVGIDIEKVHPKIIQLAAKFLSPQEEAYNTANPLQAERLCLIWCAKEALYKLYGRKNLSFRAHMHIEPFSYQRSGTINGLVSREGQTRQHRLQYETLEDYILVYLSGNTGEMP